MASRGPGREPEQTAQPPASPTGGEGAFTGYLRVLERDAEPPPAAFDELWQALRTTVVAELRRSYAWSSPPSYLGVFGWPAWQAPGADSQSGPLAELLTDCYVAVFLEQRPRLRAQLAVKADVDGLVVLTLRHYLQKRRQHNDRLGFLVFKSLRLAVREAIGAGELWVLDGSPKILNPTLLATSPGADADDVAGREVLAPVVEGWVRELMPEMVTAQGVRRREVVARLRRFLLDLEAEGVRAFRFKDLIDPLKHQVRGRWAAVFDHGQGEQATDDDVRGFADVVRLVRPDDRLDTDDSFEKLVACVAGLVEELREPARTRHYLRTLWGFLRAWAEGEESAGASDNLPTGRRLGELLRIPRKRLPSLWELLRELVRRCQAGLFGRRCEDAGEDAS